MAGTGGLGGLQFISVMTPAASATTLTLELTTQNLNANFTLTLSVSGISTAESENQFAQRIASQLDTTITQQGKAFSGIPTYYDMELQGQFVVGRTDHCVSIWSQCQFEITATANTTGAVLKIGPSPTLVTVAKARSLATVGGIGFEDVDGNALTDSQLADLLEMSSGLIIAFIKNNIVTSTYLQHVVCDGSYSIWLKKTPVQDFIAPQSRFPTVGLNLSMLYGTVKNNYGIDPWTGEVNYRFAQDLLNLYEPFERKNEILLPYIAGYYTIPEPLKSIIVGYTVVVQNMYSNDVKSYKGGSFAVVFSDIDARYKAMLRPYFLGD